jgi:hypothetical protein
MRGEEERERERLLFLPYTPPYYVNLSRLLDFETLDTRECASRSRRPRANISSNAYSQSNGLEPVIAGGCACLTPRIESCPWTYKHKHLPTHVLITWPKGLFFEAFMAVYFMPFTTSATRHAPDVRGGADQLTHSLWAIYETIPPLPLLVQD